MQQYSQERSWSKVSDDEVLSGIAFRFPSEVIDFHGKNIRAVYLPLKGSTLNLKSVRTF
jgi:hypothetical protein